MPKAVEPCDRLDGCRFFLRPGLLEAVATSWKRLYCECVSKSRYCIRKEKMLAGEEVPPAMAPTGQLLD